MALDLFVRPKPFISLSIVLFITIVCYTFSRTRAEVVFSPSGGALWTGGQDCSCGTTILPCSIPTYLISTNATNCSITIMPGQYSGQILRMSSTAGLLVSAAGNVLDLNLQLSGAQITLAGELSSYTWTGNLNFTSTTWSAINYLNLTGSSILVDSPAGLYLNDCAISSPADNNATLFQSTSPTSGWTLLSLNSCNIDANDGIIFETTRITGRTSVTIEDSNLSGLTVLSTYLLGTVIVRRSTIQSTGRIFQSSSPAGPTTVEVSSCTLSSPTLNNIYYGTASSHTSLTIYNTTMTNINLAVSSTTSSVNYTYSTCTDCVIDGTRKVALSNMTLVRATNDRISIDMIIQNQLDLDASFIMITTATTSTMGLFISNTTFTADSSFITRDTRFSFNVEIPGVWFNNGSLTSTAAPSSASIYSSNTSLWTFTATTATSVNFYMDRGGLLIYLVPSSPATRNFFTTASFALPPNVQIQWDTDLLGMPVAGTNYTLLTAANLTGSAPNVVPSSSSAASATTTLSFATFLSSDGKSLLYRFLPPIPALQPAETCNPAQRPNILFQCIGSTWTLPANASTSGAGLVVVVSSHVVIEGNFSFVGDSLTFIGLSGSINVTGCVSIRGTISVKLTSADISAILMNSATSYTLISSECSTLDSSTSIVVTSSSNKDMCEKVTAGAVENGNSSLSAVFSINRSGCSKKSSTWWIALVSVLGGIVVVALVIALVVTFVPSVKAKVRPFWSRTRASK